MHSSSVADTLGFDVTAGERPQLQGLIGKTVLLNELIAVPVALVMTAVGGGFPEMLGIATTYSQLIGLTCAIVGWAAFDREAALSIGVRRAVVTVRYFLSGVAGAEMARRLCPVIFGESFDSGSPIVSWAIGASIAVIVGAVHMTVRHLRAQIASTELAALQARINPHFLFNTLNSIAALIREDPHRAEAMTLQLSSLFRYTLQAPRSGLVTVAEEATIVEGYLAIEQERLGERLTYHIDIDDAVLRLRVPPLVLQPLVENAIKHGIAPSVRGGTVSVRGWMEGDTVSLEVENTGVGDGEGDRETAGTGEGLDNVRRRLRATFGHTASATLRRVEGGTEARLTFTPKGQA
jgi:hypothetical protein